MRALSYQIISSNLDLARKTIDYFMAEIVSPELFEEIKSIGIKWSNKMNKLNGENFIGMGYLSVFDFMMYMSDTKQMGDGIKMHIVEVLVHALEDEGIVSFLPENFGNLQDRRYKANGDFAKFFYDRDLILNLVCGWRYIIDKYSNSVLKIEHETQKGDFSIGTGFYYVVGNEKYIKPLVITNKHVIENAKAIKIFTKNDIEIKYSAIQLDEKRDLGFIELDTIFETPTFHLNPAREVLSEVLTIGYPSIPMTIQAYQVYHKGEVNSFVEDYSGNQLFLFSAKTSSGNSGSPIIDKYGMVVGIVTEELFEQELFDKKGKPAYYAGIPAEEIINSANKYIFIPCYP